MKAILEPIRELAEFEKLNKQIEKTGSAVMVSGCVDASKAYLTYSLDDANVKVFITYDEIRARQILSDVEFYSDNCYYYPAKDFIFYSADMHSSEVIGQRLNVVSRLIKHKKQDEALIIVTTIDGCADLLMQIEDIAEAAFNVKEQDIVDVEKLKTLLVRLGYERMGMVQGPGQFAIRGGIIDIFMVTEAMPVRIELWDDEVDSIRSFDLETQRSVDRLDEIEIFPATECVFTEKVFDEGIDRLNKEFEAQMEHFKGEKNAEGLKNLRQAKENLEFAPDYSRYIRSFVKEPVTFIDYFDKKNTIFILDEPNRLKERMELCSFEFEESCKNRLAAGFILASQSTNICGLENIYGKLKDARVVALAALDYKPEGIKVKEHIQIEAKGINSYNNQFEMLVKDLKKYKKNNYRVVLVSGSKSRAMRLSENLRDCELSSYYGDGSSDSLVPGQIMVTNGNVKQGFEYPLVKFVVITESDIFGARNASKQRRKKYDGEHIREFSELSVGDYVIHESHGLGIYRGIEQIRVEGTLKDYITLEYSNGGKLYILPAQLDTLQKYAGMDTDKKPKLNSLGTQEWSKTKGKVQRAVEEVAKDLVELYAKRQLQSGFVYGKDTVWQKEFEELFPYEETFDQKKAIEDTKADMESVKIMDRLICGDVGFGKTEVAIRAAFKAIQESKQVAYLVPTTILAQQHYNTFVERMKSFPVNVALMSRFKSSAQNKKTAELLKQGRVDVVIGTHRLLSKDVEYKDLGLLIIDEEQRFGVTHKEKIKKLKENVDVLSLSATPIPRTLHMSLVGIRDMSVLEEPPTDRMPIQTFVTEENDEIIREAIRREMGRNGQVYYVHNKVNNIDEVAAKVQNLVPEANVVFAHGRMDERTLEKIMMDFVNGEIDVLVSTTIIETGLDIPNVNTIIIQDADKFGLSQLYQLRGRVGRSNRMAYAFLLYKKDKYIKEVAEKRLKAIRDFTDLGSGFKIAMKDLEIRGAGNVLGSSQHGHMAAVGYDLYCKMLNEAVNTLKGGKEMKVFETCVDIPVNAYISDEYIKSESEKFDIYKRIACIESEEDKIDIEDELTDRYGEIPQNAENLLNIALLKSKLHRCFVVEAKGEIEKQGSKNYYRTTIRLHPQADNINVAKIPEFVGKYGNAMRFKNDRMPYFVYTIEKARVKGEDGYINALLELADDFNETVVFKE